jgi:hypothetical protein
LRKYTNHAQLVQGVSQVADDSLTQGERLCLLTLAAFNVKTDPHPGNEKLARACGVKTRQGVNYLIKKLLDRRLIEITGHARGGRGMAVTYRIRVEDDRFPPPRKAANNPATPDLHVSDDKPASPHLQVTETETRKCDPENPQVEAPKPASPDLHPDFNSGYKNGNTPPYPPHGGRTTDHDFQVPGGYIRVTTPRNARLVTQRDREIHAGSNSQDWLEFFRRKGWKAEFVSNELAGGRS